jgi:Holliday junction resolvase RusA-like endonuclease
MNYIKIKPLSVNDAWKGRRFKTDEYKNYNIELLWKLPRIEVPKGKLLIYLEWGFSSAGSDFDNPTKPFCDVLQEKYGFNDNRIVDANIKTFSVKKGCEYIKYYFKSADEYEFQLVKK